MADLTIAQEDWDAVTREREDPNTEPPVQTAPPAEVAETQDAPTQVAVDPYEGLHPEVQAKLKQFDQLAASLPNLVNDLKATKGRIGALQSEWARQRTADQPSQTQIAAAAKDPEKWASLKQDFPEWGEGIQEFVDARLAKLPAAGMKPEEIEQLVAQRSEAKTAELERTFSERLVTLKHPTWRAEVNTPEFGQWLRTQDAAMQAKADSTDPFDAIEMLDTFAKHKATPVKQVTENRQQRLQQAVTATRGSKPVVKTFEEMTPEEQWNYLAKEREKRDA